MQHWPQGWSVEGLSTAACQLFCLHGSPWNTDCWAHNPPAPLLPSSPLSPPPPPRPPSLTWHPHLDLVEALLDDVCLVPHVAAGHGLQHGPARHGALGQGLVKHLGGLRARLGREARDLNHLLLLAAAAAAVGGGGGAGALAAALLLVLLLVLMLVLLLLCITARGPACR
jgi:hypothetical protein